ncbi:MAG TPA: ATP-binding protein [Candidatus Methylomirabilis sp.]|nr:ATP-binding protein [Candidatus Methylomirabilis sp.]
MSHARSAKTKNARSRGKSSAPVEQGVILRELLAYLRESGEQLRQAWRAEMDARGLLKGLTQQEVEAEPATIYEALVHCLETGRYHSAQAYARAVAERGVIRGIGAKQVIGGLLALRDVCGRGLHHRFRRRWDELMQALDLYEPVVNRILTIVALAFVQEREKAVGRGREQLAALVEGGMVLAVERSLDSVLQRIVEVACKLLLARYGALGVLDGKGGLERFVTSGMDEEVRARIGSLPVGKGILGVVVREARPIRLRDLTQDPRAHGFPSHHPPMRSFLGVPIICKGRIFGNLYLTEKQEADEFSKEDERLAMTLAAQAGIAIENASLYEELRRSYEELKQSQALLVRQEKLASLGRLAAGVAHELNNPLSSVAGFAEALQRRAAEGEGVGHSPLADCQEYLDVIQAEVARAAAIVRRLLDFSRQREPAFGPLDLQSVVTDAVSFVKRQASLANQQIILAPFPEAFEVRGDVQMLQQVFLNLLTNALDAVATGGEVRISAEHASLEQGRPWVTVHVADNGTGISTEDLPRIFDPFFTTKEVGKGTGLGLAICQSIVEQHGGTIEVRSEGRGKGTVVTVRLPLVKPAKAPAEPSAMGRGGRPG